MSLAKQKSTVMKINVQPSDAHWLKQVLDIEDFESYVGPIDTDKIKDSTIAEFNVKHSEYEMSQIRVCTGQTNAWVEAIMCDSGGNIICESEPTHDLFDNFILTGVDIDTSDIKLDGDITHEVQLVTTDYDIVDMPDLEIVKSTEEKDGIMAFYEALGFDNENHKTLKPFKVIMNEEDQIKMQQIYSNEYEEDEKVPAMMLFMNKGPSSDKGVERGKVLLEKDWLEK